MYEYHTYHGRVRDRCQESDNLPGSNKIVVLRVLNIQLLYGILYTTSRPIYSTNTSPIMLCKFPELLVLDSM